MVDLQKVEQQIIVGVKGPAEVAAEKAQTFWDKREGDIKFIAGAAVGVIILVALAAWIF